MITLKMRSWKNGIQTVSLIQAVKLHSTGSLIQAKIEVERLLAGEIVTLEFSSLSERDIFQKKAENFGVIF
jgi:hypothetical protein